MNSREACQVTKLAEVPLQVLANRPIVDVTFGDRPARLMLDTGATHTILTDAAFSRLGLNYDLNISVTSSGVAGQAIARMSQPVRVTIGGYRLPPTPVISISSATALDAKSGIDGLLGVDSLAAQDLDIDMPHRKLGLYAARQCPDGPAPFAGPSVSFKSPANTRNYLYVPALADGQALSLIVDTGATSTYLSQRRLGLSDASVAGEKIVQAASSGPARSPPGSTSSAPSPWAIRPCGMPGC